MARRASRFVTVTERDMFFVISVLVATGLNYCSWMRVLVVAHDKAQIEQRGDVFYNDINHILREGWTAINYDIEDEVLNEDEARLWTGRRIDLTKV